MYIETDLGLNCFQFISIRNCTNNANVANFVYYRKTQIDIDRAVVYLYTDASSCSSPPATYTHIYSLPWAPPLVSL